MRKKDFFFVFLAVVMILITFRAAFGVEYYVPSNYSSLQACVDARNNTVSCCVILGGNYSETLVGNSYVLGDANCAVEVRVQNVSIDFNNSVFDGAGGTVGLLYARKGGDLNVSNAVFWNYSNNYQLDSIGDTLPVFLKNLVSRNGASYVWGDVNLTNFTAFNGGLIVSEGLSSLVSYYDGITMVGMTGSSTLDFSGAYGAVISNVNISSIASVASYLLVLTSSQFVNLSNITIMGDQSVAGIILGDYMNLVDNCSISGVTTGLYTGSSNGYHNVSNCLFFNTTMEGIDNEGVSSGNVYSHNVFNLTGNLSSSDEFFIGNTMYSYGGVDFNATTPLIVNSALNDLKYITADNFSVNTHVTGSNNFALWLVDLPGASLLNISTLVEEPNGMSCADVATLYSGTCYLDSQDYLVANGLANYTVGSVVGLSIIGGSSPAYLRYENMVFQGHPALKIGGDSCTVLGNSFFNSSNDLLYSLVVNGTNNYVSLNNFYYEGFQELVASNFYCVNSLGNFYADGITPMSGDCGQVALSNSSINGSTLTSPYLQLNFTNQSSINNMTYDVWMSPGGSGYGLLYSGRSPFFSINGLNDSTNYFFKIIPSDGLFNGTIDYFQFFVRYSVGGGGGSSVPSSVGNVSGGGLVYVEPFDFFQNSVLKKELLVKVFVKDGSCALSDSSLKVHLDKEGNVLSGLPVERLSTGVFQVRIPLFSLDGKYEVVVDGSDSRSFVVSKLPVLGADGLYSDERMMAFVIVVASCVFWVGLFGYCSFSFLRSKSLWMFLFVFGLLIIGVFVGVNLWIHYSQAQDFGGFCSMSQVLGVDGVNGWWRMFPLLEGVL